MFLLALSNNDFKFATDAPLLKFKSHRKCIQLKAAEITRGRVFNCQQNRVHRTTRCCHLYLPVYCTPASGGELHTGVSYKTSSLAPENIHRACLENIAIDDMLTHFHNSNTSTAYAILIPLLMVKPDAMISEFDFSRFKVSANKCCLCGALNRLLRR